MPDTSIAWGSPASSCRAHAAQNHIVSLRIHDLLARDAEEAAGQITLLATWRIEILPADLKIQTQRALPAGITRLLMVTVCRFANHRSTA